MHLTDRGKTFRGRFFIFRLQAKITPCEVLQRAVVQSPLYKRNGGASS